MNVIMEGGMPLEVQPGNGNGEVVLEVPSKLLYFSDGVEEVIDKEFEQELGNAPQEQEEVDTKSLTWVPWLSHFAWKSGTKMLNAVDYAGEGLANFFGITTPKYQLEINEYERLKLEKEKMENESAGWVSKTTGGEIPLVLSEPMKSPNN